MSHRDGEAVEQVREAEAEFVIELGDAAALTLGSDSESTENKQTPYS
ncbi:albusnodin family lasso peptide [Streptomyces sp. NPDC051162]